jgi:hypothetical protein
MSELGALITAIGASHPCVRRGGADDTDAREDREARPTLREGYFAKPTM